MRSRIVTCAALLGAATVTACSSSGEPEKIRVTVTQTVTVQPSPQGVSATAGDALKMGVKKDITDPENDLHITVQTLEYQQPYKGPQPGKPQDFQGGDTWATARVKVCNVQGVDVEVSQFPWSLAYEDGTSIEVTGSSGGDMPKPEFPMGRTVKPGRCAAGLIAFPVPSDSKPERLVYEPEGGELAEWSIG